MMCMDNPSMHVTKSNKHKSELEKFQIFYEFATSKRDRVKSSRVRRNDA